MDKFGRSAVDRQTEPEGLGRIGEVAAYLAMSRAGLYSLMGSGALPYVQIDKRRRIPWDAVRKLIEAKSVTQHPAKPATPEGAS